METPRLLFALTLAACLGLAPSLRGSGGWFDMEPPHSLEGDLDRLPAKSLGAIILELRAEQASGAAGEDANAQLPEGFFARIGQEKPATLAGEIDRLVARARRHYEENRDWLPALYDIRDAIVAPGVPDGLRRAYCEKRAAELPAFTATGEPASFAPGDPLRPHLLYLQGAAQFSEGDRTECRPWFEEIVSRHGDHPRAEGARFLLARCSLSASRSETAEEAEKERARAEALAGFRDYIQRYPQGRYVADAHGWIGALLWQEEPAAALRHYITQLEDPEHPECKESAAHMIERVLGRVVGDPQGENKAVLRVVAQHPLVALAAVYFVLNAPEVHPNDGKYDEPASLKQWRLRVLPLLARAVADEKARYTGAWSLRMRAMLAQAASAEGQQKEALKLTGSDREELLRSDDLLFARIVALQRAGQAGEAEKAASLFLNSFPGSPLREGVLIRRAQALVDVQRAGEAYVLLSEMEAREVDRWHGSESPYPPSESQLAPEDSAVYPDIQGADARAGLLFTLREFAPLPELEVALKSPAFQENEEAYRRLRYVVAMRWANRENFAAALSCLQGDQDEDDAKLAAALQALAQLAAAVDQASGKENQAKAMVALADAYEASHLLEFRSPLHSGDSVREGLIAREDAKALGYAKPDEELEGHHELRHATKWWLRAARTVPASALSAQARLKVLHGMEQIALSSDYDFIRAREIRADEASRVIYDILRKENPGSAEARAAAYRSFPLNPAGLPEPGSLLRPPSPRGEPDYDREVEMVRLLGGYRALPHDAFGEFPPCHTSDDPSNPVLDPIREALNEVSLHPETWPTALTQERLAEWLETARPAAENASQVKVINALEDLQLLLRHNELPQDARTLYVQLRLRFDDWAGWRYGDPAEDPRPALPGLFAQAKASPALRPVADFVEYAELYQNESDHGEEFSPTYPSYRDVEKACRRFLQTYPQSERREACHLLLLRALFRQMPERWLHAAPPSGAPEDEPGPLVESTEPFRPAPLLKAIASYEKEFPRARYAAELRNFRGIIAWRTGDYAAALDLTLAQLDDMEHKDMRREAAVRLANLFADLADHRYRETILSALRTRPQAVEWLRAYMAIAPGYADHPLRCLGSYIEERLESL